MKKKVIYLDSKTGKELHYGDYVTFERLKPFKHGYGIHTTSSIPLINDTIPYLIEKGIIVQKEVEIEESSKSEKDICDLLAQILKLQKVIIMKLAGDEDSK